MIFVNFKFITYPLLRHMSLLCDGDHRDHTLTPRRLVKIYVTSVNCQINLLASEALTKKKKFLQKKWNKYERIVVFAFRTEKSEYTSERSYF